MAFGLWNEPVPDDEAYPWKAVEGVEAEKEEEQDSQREEALLEKGDREKDFFSESNSERAPSLAGSLPYTPMFPGSRESPRRPGSCVLYYAENQPMLYGSPESPRHSGTQGRENQPILPGSGESPQRATPQGPQDSPLDSLNVVSERLRGATLQAMGQTTDQGERNERSGRDGRGGRGGRQFDLRR